MLVYPLVEKLSLIHDERDINDEIEEDDVMCDKTSLIKKENPSIFNDDLNEKLVIEASTFMSMITCGICYGVVSIDKKPV